MNEREFTDQEKENQFAETFNFETTNVNGKTYNVDKLKQFAESLPILETATQTFEGAVRKGNYYWLDKNSRKLGPHDLLEDWVSAQENPDWADHVQNIKSANLDNPIWIFQEDGVVFDGMHRLTRALIEHQPNIKYRLFDSLPKEAEIN